MFLLFTADDAIQSYTLDSVNSFLAHRRNPNGCAPKMTYFTSTNYTSYQLVTQWYVEGNEIADHTMTHVGSPSAEEINGNLRALNAFAGIPLSEIAGFRAPFLNYTTDTLRMLRDAGFTYDSSMTSASRANATDTDAFFPYTLDSGVANDCLNGVEGLCQGQFRLPGFWEIPMYSTFDNTATGIHLMDPYLDANDTSAVLSWLQNTFLEHYEHNRQPFGIYTHPIHLATGYPGVRDPTAQITMINQFLDWAQTHNNVWIVSNKQLLEWMRNPVPVSQLNDFAPLRCTTPAVPADLKICNGIPQNQAGLTQQCPWTDWSSSSCYGCPATPPLPDNPVPPQVEPPAGQQLRFRLPANCSTAFFDPIRNTCLCQDSSCAFTDGTKAIGPNGEGIVSPGGTGTQNDANGGNAAKPSQYRSFNSASTASASAFALSLFFIAAAALL